MKMQGFPQIASRPDFSVNLEDHCHFLPFFFYTVSVKLLKNVSNHVV